MVEASGFAVDYRLDLQEHMQRAYTQFYYDVYQPLKADLLHVAILDYEHFQRV
jgi:hypothetical protein